MNAISTCEDMLLLSMCCDKEYSNNVELQDGFFDKKRDVTMCEVDVGSLLHFPAMHPKSMYAFALTEDSDRLFSTCKDYLAAHPVDILKDSAEVACVYDGTMKWVGLRRLKSVPKGLYALTGAVSWYEYHFRMFFFSGKQSYFKRIVAFNRDGSVSPVKSRHSNVYIGNPKQEGEFSYLVASIIEDSHRAGTMLASVQDNTELRFAVPLDDYQKMFLDRDGPMKNCRKKAIIHWVSKHLRKNKSGESKSVCRHVRGVGDITIDGLRISITPNDAK